jgi:hypothetical protein
MKIIIIFYDISVYQKQKFRMKINLKYIQKIRGITINKAKIFTAILETYSLKV